MIINVLRFICKLFTNIFGMYCFCCVHLRYPKRNRITTLKFKDMTKVRVYMGTDTYGVLYEIAITSDGKVFHRNMQFNGYGKGWSKWVELKNFNGEFYVSQYGKEMLKYGWGMDANFLGILNRKISIK